MNIKKYVKDIILVEVEKIFGELVYDLYFYHGYNNSGVFFIKGNDKFYLYISINNELTNINGFNFTSKEDDNNRIKVQTCLNKTIEEIDIQKVIEELTNIKNNFI